MEDIHKNIEMIKAVAMQYAKDHNCNYNIILHNPNEKGEFDSSSGSTYEFVIDSYFEKPRPNVILLYKTDDLISNERKEKIAIIGVGDIGSTSVHLPDENGVRVVSGSDLHIPLPTPFVNTRKWEDIVYTPGTLKDGKQLRRERREKERKKNKNNL